VQAAVLMLKLRGVVARHHGIGGRVIELLAKIGPRSISPSTDGAKDADANRKNDTQESGIFNKGGAAIVLMEFAEEGGDLRHSRVPYLVMRYKPEEYFYHSGWNHANSAVFAPT
jgi:hypothetical protein